MSVAETVLRKLPDQTRGRLASWYMRTGLYLREPAYRMLFRTFEFMGGDPFELRKALSEARDVGQSLIDSLRALGGEIGHLARIVDETGEAEVARDLYFRAALYYLAADWFTYDHEDSVWNYALALPCFDRFRALAKPPIEKIEFPYRVGSISAHFRVPYGRRDPFPVVVIIQGNDTVKECMVSFEDFAVTRGIATLTVDPPGWGESGLSGNRFRSLDDLKQCSQLAVDFLQQRGDIRPEAIGVFGVSFGGLLAACCAGLEPRFAAVAGIGGPFIGLSEIWHGLPAAQARRACRYTGLTNPEELERWRDQLEVEARAILPQVRCPALVVHGSDDRLVPPRNARALAAEVSGEAEVRLVEGGDHLCTQFLFNWVADFVFDWFTTRLEQKAENTYRNGLPREEEPTPFENAALTFGQRQAQQAI